MSASRENVRYFINYCWFALDVTAAMLVVCWWSEQKHFSPLGTIPYFHENSPRKNSILLTTNTHPTWPPCHVVANQENAKVIYFVSSNERRRRKQRKKSKKNWFMSKTTSLHVHLVFWYIPWRHCTTPDATFYGGRLYTTTNFPFSFWSWIKFVRIQLQEKAPTFNKLKGSK